MCRRNCGERNGMGAAEKQCFFVFRDRMKKTGLKRSLKKENGASSF
jgi:hypothetical protein